MRTVQEQTGGVGPFWIAALYVGTITVQRNVDRASAAPTVPHAVLSPKPVSGRLALNGECIHDATVISLF